MKIDFRGKEVTRLQTKKRHPVRTVFFSILLALLCVGAAELVVCRYAAPELYRSVTESMLRPLRRTVSQTRWKAGRLLVRLRQKLDPQTVRSSDISPEIATLYKPSWFFAPEPDQDAQIAEEPAVIEPVAPAQPSVTELILSQDVETLTGGNCLTVYFNQLDDEWAGLPYGWDPIGRYGCGPVSLSIAVSSLTGCIVDPGEMASWAASEGYWMPKSGSLHSIVEGAASYYNITCTPVSTLSVESLREGLSEGGLMVALMGPGHFTRRGHFIVLRGLTSEGKILVADPASREKSVAEWDAETIVRELYPGRKDGAPLWHLTVPETSGI